jgi:hypothetical protein
MTSRDQTGATKLGAYHCGAPGPACHEAGCSRSDLAGLAAREAGPVERQPPGPCGGECGLLREARDQLREARDQLRDTWPRAQADARCLDHAPEIPGSTIIFTEVKP